MVNLEIIIQENSQILDKKELEVSLKFKIFTTESWRKN